MCATPIGDDAATINTVEKRKIGKQPLVITLLVGAVLILSAVGLTLTGVIDRESPLVGRWELTAIHVTMCDMLNPHYGRIMLLADGDPAGIIGSGDPAGLVGGDDEVHVAVPPPPEQHDFSLTALVFFANGLLIVEESGVPSTETARWTVTGSRIYVSLELLPSPIVWIFNISGDTLTIEVDNLIMLFRRV